MGLLSQNTVGELNVQLFFFNFFYRIYLKYLAFTGLETRRRNQLRRTCTGRVTQTLHRVSCSYQEKRPHYSDGTRQ